MNTIQDFHKLYYDAPRQTWQNTYWHGVPVQKNPCDLWVYQELIFKLKPDLIIECGTLCGGSALYLAHMCDLVGNGKIVSIDVRPQNPPEHNRIWYLVGSST